MKPLIKRKGKFVHSNSLCDYMHTLQTYVDAINMWDVARRVRWVRWVEVWVKKVWGRGRPEANFH
jgi:hypothetical protein